jgi:hypothetical protein
MPTTWPSPNRQGWRQFRDGGKTNAFEEVAQSRLAASRRGRIRACAWCTASTRTRRGSCSSRKTASAQKHVSHQFQNNQVKKEYLALVAGRPYQDEGDIDAPMARHPSSPRKMAIAKQRPPRANAMESRRIPRPLHVCFASFPKPARPTRSESTSNPSACRWPSIRSTTPPRQPAFFSAASSEAIASRAGRNGR